MIVGILGGGQLARMLALAGLPLGLTFRFLDTAADACALPLGEALVGAFDDRRLLDRLAGGARVVTYEFENVSLEGAEYLAQRVPVHPSPKALHVKQDRLREKRLFVDLGIPTAPFHPVETAEDLADAAGRLGFPMVLKLRSLGYDGKGQAVIHEESDLMPAWERLGRAPLVAERFVRFDREVSILAVRGRGGDVACYPLAENVHGQGILHSSMSRPGDDMTARARDYADRLLSWIGHVGLFTLELFQVGEELMANELAPRVHNSGHWTIEGAETSQFENHLRAILDLPLGSTAPVGAVAMVNCIGQLPDIPRLLQIPGVHPHVYGKPPRPGRKVGHVTVRGADDGEVQERLTRVREVMSEAGSSAR